MRRFLGGPGPGHTVYSNTTNFTSFGHSQGGVTSGAGPTFLAADDITPISGFAGDAVTSFTFSIFNANSTAVSVFPTVSFYQSDGTSSGPGTLIAAIPFSALTQPSGATSQFTASTPGGFFNLPSSFFWAGISFTSVTATQAQLNNIGQGIFTPPTIGSSQDVFFKGNAPDTQSSNPGGGFLFFGGNPAADFGWSFNVGTPVVAPEPSSLAVLGLGLLGVAGLALRAKRRHAPAA